MGGFGSSARGGDLDLSMPSIVSQGSGGFQPAAKPSAATGRGPSKGLKLGKAKKANDLMESLAKVSTRGHLHSAASTGCLRLLFHVGAAGALLLRRLGHGNTGNEIHQFMN